MWAETFAVNVTGVFLAVQAFLPQLRAAPAGKIAIIGSQMGSDTRAPGGSFIYRASKAAALNLGRNLAADLQPRGHRRGHLSPRLGADRHGRHGSRSDGRGLRRRPDPTLRRLTLEATGRFLCWDGRDHPY